MRKRLFYLGTVVSFILVRGLLEFTSAAEFFCPAGDVTCLIAAISAFNQNGQENTIISTRHLHVARHQQQPHSPEGFLEGNIPEHQNDGTRLPHSRRSGDKQPGSGPDSTKRN